MPPGRQPTSIYADARCNDAVIVLDACAAKTAWSPCYGNGSLELRATREAAAEATVRAPPPCAGSKGGYKLYARSALDPAGPWSWGGAAEPLCCDVAALCPPCPGQPQLDGSAAWQITGSGVRKPH